MNKRQIEQFVKERNEALYSLDRDKILAFVRKYNGEEFAQQMENADELVFWGSVYKGIANITNAPKAMHNKAIAWLKEHGFSPVIK